MNARVQQWMKALQHEQTARLALVLAAVLLAWLLGRLWWLLLTGPAPSLPVPALAARAVAQELRVQPERIAAVFGDRQQAVAEAPGNTTLQLRLGGVMESEQRELARAFIAERSGGTLETYKIGDRVPGGATLDQVLADRVVLLRGGREEILRFDETSSSAPPATAGTGSQAQRNAEQTRAALANMAEQLANSPLAALRQMGLRRTSRGYVVSVAAPKEMLQRFGLQPGDRLVSINGQPLGTDMDADVEVMAQLQEAGNARVEVQRGAQTITLEQKL